MQAWVDIEALLGVGDSAAWHDAASFRTPGFKTIWHQRIALDIQLCCEVSRSMCTCTEYNICDPNPLTPQIGGVLAVARSQPIQIPTLLAARTFFQLRPWYYSVQLVNLHLGNFSSAWNCLYYTYIRSNYQGRSKIRLWPWQVMLHARPLAIGIQNCGPEGLGTYPLSNGSFLLVEMSIIERGVCSWATRNESAEKVRRLRHSEGLMPCPACSKKIKESQWIAVEQ